MSIFKNNNFDYPVLIDMDHSIDRLNRLPQNASYQCFLLDKNNKVLMIGNPMHNPKIWELYKQQISGKADANTQAVTSISVEPEIIELDDLAVGKKSSAVFKIKNTGTEPFIIHRVDASCGCTVPVLPALIGWANVGRIFMKYLCQNI